MIRGVVEDLGGGSARSGHGLDSVGCLKRLHLPVCWRWRANCVNASRYYNPISWKRSALRSLSIRLTVYYVKLQNLSINS